MNKARVNRWWIGIAVLAGLALSACQANGSKTARVFVSLPLQGPKIGNSVRQGIDLAFAEIGNQIGATQIDLIVLDDGNASGQWQPELETSNAQKAVADERAVAYLGPLDSGAAKISIPLLNRANLLQISPSATWPGLTKAGYAQGEPGLFYPTGERTFFRTVPTDEAQAPAAALWARSMGLRTFYVLDDGESYGAGVSRLFSNYAEQIGLVEVGRQTLDKTAQDYRAILEEVKQANPDLVYFGGTVANGAAQVLKQMRDLGITAKFMGPAALVDTSFISQAGPAAEGAFLTFAGLPADHSSAELGQKFYRDYQARFNEAPEAFAQYGYDAGRAIIEAIRRAPTLDRAGVLQGLHATPSFEGPNGVYTFDAHGDSSMRVVSGNVVENGVFKFIQALNVP